MSYGEKQGKKEGKRGCLVNKFSSHYPFTQQDLWFLSNPQISGETLKYKLILWVELVVEHHLRRRKRLGNASIKKMKATIDEKNREGARCRWATRGKLARLVFFFFSSRDSRIRRIRMRIIANNKNNCKS